MKLVCPGSFDPITYGHVDIIQRGVGLCSHLVVAVLDNPTKSLEFSAIERAGLIEIALKERGINAEVDIFRGLLAEYAKKVSADAILRGIRNPQDFLTEYHYSVYNKKLSGGVETVFLPGSPNFSYVSSSIVKEAAKLLYENANDCSAIDEWVPRNVKEALVSKFFKG